MRKIIILVLLSLTLAAKTDTPLEQRARNYAEEYYSSFQQLSQIENPYEEGADEVRQLENKIMKLAGADQFGHDVLADFRVSNDIDPILGSDNSGKSDVTLSNYVGHFIDYAAKYDFGYSYKVVSCDMLEAPSMKGMEIDEFVKVMVRKTYSYANRFNDVDETMVLAFSKNSSSMSSISNSFGTAQSSGDLLAQALEYYSEKQYKEALAMFEKQIELFGAPEAYWYAAIMYLKNQGCKGMKRKERDEKAINYLLYLKRQWDNKFKASIYTDGFYVHSTYLGDSFSDERLRFHHKAVSLLGILGIY
jgi:hypothetical protein